MDDLKKIEEDVLGESYCSDTDVTSHMREKIRTQAHRLRNLEQYRLLCEQRIIDLHPNHPLPVKPEHLGVGQSLSNDLAQAKKKILRLESQLHKFQTPSIEELPDVQNKYDVLIKDKIQLEESLRSEMLENEEQRAYIEILKQALEEKGENRVMAKPEPQKSVPKKPEENPRDSFKEDSDKRLKHLIEVKDKEIQDLAEEKKTLEAHLKDAGEALQVADEEMSRLEEEKNNLLDYIDEHSAKEAEMKNELEEISKYFEEIKNELDETKEKLELEMRVKEQFKTNSETWNEDIVKGKKRLEELEKELKEFKLNSIEKDGILRKLKEEKLALEIKVENLQANASTLAETLKETQTELEECERSLQELKKSDYSKDDVIAKQKSDQHLLFVQLSSAKEELVESKRQLEMLQKEKNLFEKTKDFELKQIQELKSINNKLKIKCDSLEEEKTRKAELETFTILAQDKLDQLQEDYIYVKEAHNESQQRELIQSEALNDLRKHNNELTREVEELYRENQKLSIDFSQKTQDFEDFKLSHEELLKRFDILETEKKSLEIQLKSDKNQLKILKDQLINDKSKHEEMNKQLQIFQEISEKSAKKLKILEEELSQHKVKLKVKDREIEEERYKRLKTSEDFSILHGKFENGERSAEKLQIEIAECYKIIAGFAGKYTVLGSDNKHLISQGYKEFLLLWKDKISLNSSILASWVQNTVEEIENMSKKNFELQKELGQHNSDMLKLSSKLEDINSEDFCNKQEYLRLRGQLENWVQKFEGLKETSQREINDLKLELHESQKEIGRLTVESSAHRDSLFKTLNDVNELKKACEVLKSTLRNSEEKIGILKNDKSQLENFVKQMQKSIGNSEICKIQEEISRVRAELEVLERERLNLECQLLKFEGDPVGRDYYAIKETQSKLSNTERLIVNYRKNLKILMEDVQKEEMIQNLRTRQQECKVSENFESFPKRLGVLSSRLCESSKTMKKARFLNN